MLNYKNVCLSSFDKKKVEAIVVAATEHYEIDIKTLLNSTDRDIVTVRQHCFFLVKINTTVGLRYISMMFNKSETSVWHGIDKISNHSCVYPDTMSNLKKMIEIATPLSGAEMKSKM